MPWILALVILLDQEQTIFKQLLTDLSLEIIDGDWIRG